MKGTVFILARDDELFLERAVRSATASDWLTVWVVVDPQSADDTRVVARELSLLPRVHCGDSLHTAVGTAGANWWVLLGARDQLLPFEANRLPQGSDAYVGLTERAPRPPGPTASSTWWRGDPTRALAFANDEDAFWSTLSRSRPVWQPTALARSTAFSPRHPAPPAPERVEASLKTLEAAVSALPLVLTDDTRAVFKARIASTLDELERLIPFVALGRQLQVLGRVRQLLSVAHRCGVGRLDTALDSHSGRLSTIARAQRSVVTRLGQELRSLSRALVRR